MTPPVVLDAWGNQAITDYDHVFKQFGLQPISPAVRETLNHYLFERGIVIAHRDLDKVVSRISAKKPFINITGIASSGPFHLGHKVDVDLFLFFKQKGAQNFFAVCDIDGYVSRPDKRVPTLAAAQKHATQNTADLLALGLEPEDIYVQSKQPARYYAFTFELSKKITMATLEAIYGHLDMGKVAANWLQYADILHPQLPEFSGPMPSITGIGLDQDPHARATRDLVTRLPYKLEKPSFVYIKHLSGLKEGNKMSTSEPDSAIFLSDDPKIAEKKIQRAFTGGQPTIEEHRQKGGVLEIDKVFEMLWFHYPDTKELNRIAAEFKRGEMLSRELKQIAVDYFIPFLKEHQGRVKEHLALAQKIVSTPA